MMLGIVKMEWYIKVCKPMGKDGLGERWQQGGVCPTMNVFENQTSTRAVVAVVHCFENHATDARIKQVYTAPTGGYSERLLCQSQSTDTMEKTIYSIGGGQVHEAVTMDLEVSKTLNCMHEAGWVLVVFGVDFYNQSVSEDGSTQTLATAASTDKNKTGGVLIEWKR